MTGEQALDVVGRAVFVAGAMPDEVRAMDALREIVRVSRMHVDLRRKDGRLPAGSPNTLHMLGAVLDGTRSAAVR